jgi:acyl-CoA thioester hydrolase
MEESVIYEQEFKVRDYEVDLQGIVNNANYLHYLEHTRHEFLYSKNIDFEGLHREGKDLLVTRNEIDYKSPLTSHDRFIVTLNMYLEGNLKMVFDQKIYRLPDKKLVVKAKVYGVCLHNGKPVRPKQVLDLKELGLS